MKVATYTIAKNEEAHVARFMASAKEADEVFVVDTGSTDRTKALLLEAGARVMEAEIFPWRMDAARNVALNFVPTDYDVAVCLDMDEAFQPGWRAKIEQEWKEGVKKIFHPIISAFKPDGVTPDLIFDTDRIHARHGFVWKHPCHEASYWMGDGSPRTIRADIILEHRPNARPRSSYLPLLELMAKEEPDSDRAAHYLGREYFFKQRYDDAIREFKRHLALPKSVWDAERASSMRYIAAILHTQGKQQERLCWLMRACAEAPAYREPWVELAQAYFDNRDYVGCYYAADRALSLTHRKPYIHTKESVWAEWPHDLKGCAAFYMGLHAEALTETQKAADFAPHDARIAGNLKMIAHKLASNRK